MDVFDSSDFDGHEQVVFASDRESGLNAIIAVHDTTRGPALGGCRMYPYASEADALRDVLRLSRGMSYKAAAANVALGGGKAVIIGDPRTGKTPGLLQAMGRAIDRLGGRYITGEDIGTNPDDMAAIRQATRSVSCLKEADGGYGDPAPFTALGVVQAIRAGLEAVHGSASLAGVAVAVQGVGNVGLNLCRQLAEEGARLIACDPIEANADRAAELGARIVATGEIHAVEADVFAPCAMGSVLDERTIPQLKARVVAGAANNQLAQSRHAELLDDCGVLYLPDYVANGGGLICCAAEWRRTPRGAIRGDVLRIVDTCREVVDRARRAGGTTAAAADEMARARLAEAAHPRT
jgi:leucine dehydrogenase